MSGLCVGQRVLLLSSGYGDIDGPWYSWPSAFYLWQPSVSKEQATQSVGSLPRAIIAGGFTYIAVNRRCGWKRWRATILIRSHDGLTGPVRTECLGEISAHRADKRHGRHRRTVLRVGGHGRELIEVQSGAQVPVFLGRHALGQGGAPNVRERIFEQGADCIKARVKKCCTNWDPALSRSS